MQQHPKSAHRVPVDYAVLGEKYSYFRECLVKSTSGSKSSHSTTIDYKDSRSLALLAKVLLEHHYGIVGWRIEPHLDDAHRPAGDEARKSHGELNNETATVNGEGEKNRNVIDEQDPVDAGYDVEHRDRTTLSSQNAVDFCGYLCPAVPRSANYIHHVADLFPRRGMKDLRHKNLRVFDVGVGVSCILPLLGTAIYGWNFTASDVSPEVVRYLKQNTVAKLIAQGTPLCCGTTTTSDFSTSASSTKKPEDHHQKQTSTTNAKGGTSSPRDDNASDYHKGWPLQAVSCDVRLQKDPQKVFDGVVRMKEMQDYFACCICNPPFHENAAFARASTQGKWKNITNAQAHDDQAGNNNRNYQGRLHELVTVGGEVGFAHRMLGEGMRMADKSTFLWHTVMVSRWKTVEAWKGWMSTYASVNLMAREDQEGGGDRTSYHADTDCGSQMSTKNPTAEKRATHSGSTAFKALLHPVKRFRVCELHQGKSTKWALCWSFVDETEQENALETGRYHDDERSAALMAKTKNEWKDDFFAWCESEGSGNQLGGSAEIRGDENVDGAAKRRRVGDSTD
ncbi:unnamed protein product [Amoebophrya sp. A25]|nr:unnamed protein product [Amoebophrya sp. A25]|eukprot:GSA25T00005945001.1